MSLFTYLFEQIKLFTLTFGSSWIHYLIMGIVILINLVLLIMYFRSAQPKDTFSALEVINFISDISGLTDFERDILIKVAEEQKFFPIYEVFISLAKFEEVEPYLIFELTNYLDQLSAMKLVASIKDRLFFRPVLVQEVGAQLFKEFYNRTLGLQ